MKPVFSTELMLIFPFGNNSFLQQRSAINNRRNDIVLFIKYMMIVIQLIKELMIIKFLVGKYSSVNLALGLPYLLCLVEVLVRQTIWIRFGTNPMRD